MKTLFKFFLLLPFIICFGCKDSGHNSTKESATLDSVTETANTFKQSDDTVQSQSSEKLIGFGPVKHVEIDPTIIDSVMVAQGKTIFQNSCTTCHKIHESAMGPALSGVVQERSPEWVMNMILNPEEMLEKDPLAQSMIAKYDAQMVDKNLSSEEARKVLEYLRTY